MLELVFTILGLVLGAHEVSQPPALADAQAGYHLVWADEFNIDGRPDPNNWTYEHGFVRNEEDQWYQPDNAVCRDGLLIIEGRRAHKPNPDYQPDSRNWRRNREFINYTSSSLMTRGRHQWTYGRFEMRARIVTREGLWPAFWTLGSARRWPGCGEIDIMEYYQGDLLANACWAGPRGRSMWDSVKKPVADFNDAHWDQAFHVWRMDWNKQSIRLTVDNLLLNTVELTKTVNQTPDSANPFHEPQYLIVNLALGGRNGGDPNQAPLPTRYEIDYIRVYQK